MYPDLRLLWVDKEEDEGMFEAERLKDRVGNLKVGSMTDLTQRKKTDIILAQETRWMGGNTGLFLVQRGAL